jgi:hypothetical protein
MSHGIRLGHDAPAMDKASLSIGGFLRHFAENSTKTGICEGKINQTLTISVLSAKSATKRQCRGRAMITERRRWPRTPMNTDAEATLTADGWSQPCRIVDIGLGGAEVSLDGPTPCNREVRIGHLAAGSLYATRVWEAPGVMGVAFDNLHRARAFLTLCGSRANIRLAL